MFKDHNSILTVDVFALSYNEQFMLPHFIKHYKEQFGANIIIYDNESTDNSRQIIVESGCELRTYSSKNTIRDDYYLNIKNHCWRYSKADFVIIVDIDEFLEVDFRIHNYTIIKTRGYDIVGDVDSRMGVHNPLFSKCVMFSPKDLQHIRYYPGCHKCEPVGTIIPSKETARLLHRKYISEEYVFKKHTEYEKRLSDFNKQYNFGEHYKGTTIEKVNEKFEELRKNAILI